jgi:hypothetical protein
MDTEQKPPIDVVPLLYKLDSVLIDLLKSLTPDEWQKQTIAKLWVVKDVAAHLLDGNIRVLSMLRDNYFGEKVEVNSYEELVSFLNGLNVDWVKAMKRASPAMLISLHEATGKPFCDYYASLRPFDKAVLSVAWAGEAESKNWMHIAREYTEKWLHQQQIRDAVNKPGLMTRGFYYPFISIFMLALPHTFRNVDREQGATIQVTITGEIGGSWFLVRQKDKWALENSSPIGFSATEVILDPDIAWRLFSKSIRPQQVGNKVSVTGDQALGEVVLSMVSVMA